MSLPSPFQVPKKRKSKHSKNADVSTAESAAPQSSPGVCYSRFDAVVWCVLCCALQDGPTRSPWPCQDPSLITHNPMNFVLPWRDRWRGRSSSSMWTRWWCSMSKQGEQLQQSQIMHQWCALFCTVQTREGKISWQLNPLSRQSAPLPGDSTVSHHFSCCLLYCMFCCSDT